MDSSRIQSYSPTLNHLSLHSETDDRPLPLSDTTLNNHHITTTTSINNNYNNNNNRPRRQKSLVRPERERIDENHRQYHYRQRATHRERIEPSTTGSRPLTTAVQNNYNNHNVTFIDTSNSSDNIQANQTGTRRPAVQAPAGAAESKKRSYSSGRRGGGHHHAPVRRGQSILGRSQKYLGRGTPDEDEDEGVVGAVDFNEKTPRSCSSRLWLTYCRLLTCCIPNPLLRCMGNTDFLSIIIIYYHIYNTCISK